MRCDVLAVGTELLLGQIVDTNSSWLGEQLAAHGIDSLTQVKVGDNIGRITGHLRALLEHADAVIMCGGLGPTHDDLTREAIAAVMGVELELDEVIGERIREMFESRGRQMPENNLRQAMVPQGATVIEQTRGTAPGLICPVSVTVDGERRERVVYAVPGVPHEMRDMFDRAIAPDLHRRSGQEAVIVSRVLRTWGESESGLDERLRPIIAELDERGNPTLAFLASGWEGLKVRLTARGVDESAARAELAPFEDRIRAELGTIVFGFDDDTMESVVLQLLRDRGKTLAVAESLTGGLIGARLTGIAGSSDVFRGGVTPYDRSLKRSLLGCPDVPAVSEEMALAMAERVCVVLGTDVGIAVTGVAGPAPLEGNDPGDVWFATCIDGAAEAHFLKMPFDRERIRQFTCIMTLNSVRNRLLAEG